MENTDLKRWKTGFIDWYDNFRSAACQQIKIYSDLKYKGLSSSSDPDEIFSIQRGCSNDEKGNYNYDCTGKYQIWTRHLRYGKEQGRTALSFDELAETLNGIYGKEQRQTHQGYWMRRRADENLVESGWCSGRCWGRGEGRRRRQRSSIEATRGGRKTKRQGEKRKGTLGPIYKTKG